MIDCLTYCESVQVNPYYNQAVEEELMFCCGENECILYLWQNQHTVVIGRNQNAWKECQTGVLERDGGYLARRNSGGGAVYHDLGNLNFTFLVRRPNYSVARQMEVVCLALERLGIKSEQSGRNDILVHGRKVSGNAFYEQGDFCCHHGTLMLEVDMERLEFYLTVSKEKMLSKGVESVSSRVENLRELLPNLTIHGLKSELRQAFECVYGKKSRSLKVEELDAQELVKRERKFSSWEWKYGWKFEFQHELTHRFPWGEICLQIQVNAGRVTDAAIYSDALQPRLLEKLPQWLKGSCYEREALCRMLATYPAANSEEEGMKADMLAWFSGAER